MRPLIDGRAYRSMSNALDEAVAAGGELFTGGARRPAGHEQAYYVGRALVRMPSQHEVVRRVTFASILYALTHRDLDEAVDIHNAVPQGLSSTIFTRDQRDAERFMAADGSDCGIVNVNIGTSGADAWRAYMRRATNTITYSDDLPMPQGVNFT